MYSSWQLLIGTGKKSGLYSSPCPSESEHTDQLKATAEGPPDQKLQKLQSSKAVSFDTIVFDTLCAMNRAVGTAPV